MNVSNTKIMTLIKKKIKIGRKIVTAALITMVQLMPWKKIQLSGMFCRSVEKHNLRYTVCISDGDTSSFSEVKKALYNKFQNDYPVKKEDCIGHVQKIMGSALHIYKNKSRGSKLPDGKMVGG